MRRCALLAAAICACGEDAANKAAPLPADTQPPSQPRLIEPSAGAFLPAELVRMAWSASLDEGGSAVSYKVRVQPAGLETPAVDESTASTALVRRLADGPYVWQVLASDPAGNVSASETAGFTVDTRAPPPPDLERFPGDLVTTPRPRFEVNGIDPAAVRLEIRSWAAGASVRTALVFDPRSDVDFSPASDLPDGRYQAVAVAIDAAGNEGVSGAIAFRVDTLPPSRPAPIAPEDGDILANRNVLFRWGPSNDPGDNPVRYHLVVRPADGCGAPPPPHDRAVLLLDTSALEVLEDGAFCWTVYAVDEAGLAIDAATALLFEVDQEPPERPLLGAVGSRGWEGEPGVALLHQSTEVAFLVTGIDASAAQVRVRFGDQPSLASSTEVTSPLSGNLVGSVTVPAGVPFGDGVHYAVSVLDDRAGNTSAPSALLTFRVDTAPPYAPELVQPVGGARIRQPLFRWTKPGAAVQPPEQLFFTVELCLEQQNAFSLVGSAAVRGPAPPADPYPVSFSPNQPLAAGTYRWRVVAADAAGNEAASGPPCAAGGATFVVDLDAPEAPTLERFPGDLVSTPRPRFAVNGIDPQSVTLEIHFWIDGSTDRTVLSFDPRTAVDFSAPSDLLDGLYQAVAVVIDAAGNESTSGAISFRVDTLPPSRPTLLAPDDASITSNGNVLFRWLPAVDPGGGLVRYHLVVRPAASCGSSAPPAHDEAALRSETSALVVLQDGVFCWTAYAVDEAGLASDGSSAWSFEVDQSAPERPLVGVAASRSWEGEPGVALLHQSSDVEFLVTGIDASAWQLRVRFGTEPLLLTYTEVTMPLTGDLVGGVRVPAGVAFADGVYYAVAVLDDLAGNQSAPSALLVFRVDTVGPYPPDLSGPPDGARTNQSTPLFAWTKPASFGQPPEQIFFTWELCREQAGAYGPLASQLVLGPAPPASPYPMTFVPAQPLAEGSYRWRVVATDVAGNEAASGPPCGTGGSTFVVDQSPPAVPTPISADPPRLTWSREEGASDYLWVLVNLGAGVECFQPVPLPVAQPAAGLVSVAIPAPTAAACENGGRLRAGRYCFRVRARESLSALEVNVSDWSSCFGFEVLDQDDDSLPDSADNCPTVANADQLDTDGDQKGDACECLGVVCAGDQCHEPRSCDPATGACSDVPRPDGYACSDGKDCNGTGDMCLSGACRPGSIMRASVGPGCLGWDNQSFYWQLDLSFDGRFVSFTAPSTNLVAGDTNGAPDVFVHDRWTSQTTRVSVSSAGLQSSNQSEDPSISGDGRWVVFRSNANTLVSNDPSSNPDIYLHDRLTGATTVVSADSRGVPGDSGNTSSPAISQDGRVAVFLTDAALSPRDQSSVPDVYVRDLVAGETTLVSVSSEGVQQNADAAQYSNWEGPALSEDGGLVAFGSNGGNLVAGDTNTARDIFVHDLRSGDTTRVSVSSQGAQSDQSSWDPDLSGDGRYVVFNSYATNLAPEDSDGNPDVFLHDRSTGQTWCVSVDEAGVPQGSYSPDKPSISADGRFVAFTSYTLRVAGQTTTWPEIFVRDTLRQRTVRVSVPPAGGEANNLSFQPVLSGDGHWVGFISNATNLMPGDPNGGNPDIYVVPNPFWHDLDADLDGINVPQDNCPTVSTLDLTDSNSDGQGDACECLGVVCPNVEYCGPGICRSFDGACAGAPRGSLLVSVSTAGGRAYHTSGDGDGAPAISSTGQFVAFTSVSLDLVDGDSNGVRDVFVRDLGLGQTKRVSVSSRGEQANGPSNGQVSITDDGNRVAFVSSASNLVDDDFNSVDDVFVHDLGSGETMRVSVSSEGVEANTHSFTPSISGDGSKVAFASMASNLAPNDVSGSAYADVFVHDIASGATTLYGGWSGVGQPELYRTSGQPQLNFRGDVLAYVSNNGRLVPDDHNNISDVFANDQGTDVRVSVSSLGQENTGAYYGYFGDAGRPAISADGRVVAFSSFATSLVAGDTNESGTSGPSGFGNADIFVHDRISRETTRVNVTSAGRQVAKYSTSGSASLSANGRLVAFQSSFYLVSGDTNNRTDVFVHDRGTKETRRVSLGASGAQLPYDSLLPAISRNGQCVAYLYYGTSGYYTTSGTFVPAAETPQSGDVYVARYSPQVDAVDHLEIIRGDSQYASSGTPLPIQPTVRALDRWGGGVPGVDLRFYLRSGGGTLGTTRVTTDALGYATTSFTLGSASGVQTFGVRGDSAPLPGTLGPAAAVFGAYGVPPGGRYMDWPWTLPFQSVFAITSAGGVVYIGGAFDYLSYLSDPSGHFYRRPYIAALNEATGELLPVKFEVNLVPTALVVSGDRLYAGGYFTEAGGRAQQYMAAFNRHTGALDTEFFPGDARDPSDIVLLAAPADNALFVGHYPQAVINEQGFGLGVGLRSYSLVTGARRPIEAPVLGVKALLLDEAQGVLYFAGDFAHVGGPLGLVRGGGAAIRTATGEVTAWDPRTPQYAPPHAMAFSQSRAVIYIGGAFSGASSLGGADRDRLGAVDATLGTATGWDPKADGTVRALALSSSGTTVYAGGDFDVVGGQSRGKLAAISATTGLATGWIPPYLSGGRVNAIHVSSGKMFVGASNTGSSNLLVIREP